MSASAHDHRERDLDSPEEIAEMVRRFYQDVAQDDLLGPMFNDVAQVDWAEHLPKLAAFWCRALLGLPGYQGNPFRAHTLVHAQEPFTPRPLSTVVGAVHRHDRVRLERPPTATGRSPLPTTWPGCTATNCSAPRPRHRPPPMRWCPPPSDALPAPWRHEG
jgi:truncated hemoglobin YjbI